MSLLIAKGAIKSFLDKIPNGKGLIYDIMHEGTREENKENKRHREQKESL